MKHKRWQVMDALRAMGLVILWLVTTGGAGGGAACGALIHAIAIAPATLKVSYPATLERTHQATLEVPKELGFKIDFSNTGTFIPPSWSDMKRYKGFGIRADRAADEFAVSITGKSFDPTKTSVIIISGPTYGTEELRKTIHQKVLERLSKKPE